MAITKPQLARRAAEKLRILAPNEPFGADDEATIVAEIDTLKAELEARIFSGVTLWEKDSEIPAKLIPGFLMVLLPVLAPHYGSTTIAALPSGGADEGYRELCRQLTTGYDPTMTSHEVLATTVRFTPTAGIEATNIQSAIEEMDNKLRPGVLSVVFNNTVVSGDKLLVVVPAATTLTGWNLVAEDPCHLVLDVRRATYAAYPVTHSIVGTQPPTLVSAQKAQSADIDTWAVAVAAGEILEFVVDSVADLTTAATLTLTYLR